MTLIKSLALKGFLSFSPSSEPIELSALNVVIGPNGAGKSNLLEAIELLHAAPTEFARAIRDGGAASEWLWKGAGANGVASIEAVLSHPEQSYRQERDVRYGLKFTSINDRTEVLDEYLEDAHKRKPDKPDVLFYYRYREGHPVINVSQGQNGKYKERGLERDQLKPDESVLSQRKDPDHYPEITGVANSFERIALFREWHFGRYSSVRKPQATAGRTDRMEDDASNLALLINQLEHTDVWPGFNDLLAQFLPRFARLSTKLTATGSIQLFLHEQGLSSPVSATRLSDGTIRFISLLALLFAPFPPPLLCIEEPELGLHPDAVSLLAPVLVDASQRMQLIVTTHSDALISALSEHVESVLVCEHRGETTFERLKTEKLQHWLQTYRLGDIWRMGELGGNP